MLFASVNSVSIAFRAVSRSCSLQSDSSDEIKDCSLSPSPSLLPPELEAMLLCGESAFVKKFTYHYMTYIFVAVQAAAYIRLRFKKFSRVRSRERRTLSLIKK